MYIYLDLVPAFTCARCGDCCRNAWQVTVDETRYRANAALFARTGRTAEFAAAFVPLAAGGPGEYAAIAKQPGGGCWFLTGDHHCRLHREAGHDHLDSVCQLFPRYPMNTARGVEVTLSFSCPEVIRLASRAEPLQLVRAAAPPVALDDDSFVAAVFPGQQPLSSPLRYYFELEHHFIDIIQTRGLTVAARLAFLHDAVRSLGALPPAALGDSISRLIGDNYRRLDDTATDRGHDSPADILAENFFVNLIFKKIFYLHGLDQAMTLVAGMGREIAAARDRAADPEAEFALVRQAVMSLELHHNHAARQGGRPWQSPPRR